jgi:hypothetical protein
MLGGEGSIVDGDHGEVVVAETDRVVSVYCSYLVVVGLLGGVLIGICGIVVGVVLLNRGSSTYLKSW